MSTFALYRMLTDSEESELASFNAAVAAAIEARRTWLDAKMHECSSLQPGDDIYDLDTGYRIGKVSRLYRYWGDRDDGIRDTSIETHYEYETSPRGFDNTSRQTTRSFGTREQAIREAERRSSRLRLGEQLMGKPVAVSGQRITVYLPYDAPTRLLGIYDKDNPTDVWVKEYTLTIDQAARLLADLQSAVL
ncbi:hypothetical protein [Mycolicibacter heraklionensis]|uniref:hypothetical protein n=1 Tax=Mycolicibacter heraklionensis TaxID=512402 RepID=UPI0007EB16B2|nr:hypothetical protein [Mycolicibacter heraklionensis]OBG32403.1 hypothetical protein A5671_07675 [Mycolicibacter heraklionensis]